MNFEKIMDQAKRMDNYIFALALKCEICGPKLKGYAGNYPECSKHDISDYVGPKD